MKSDTLNYADKLTSAQAKGARSSQQDSLLKAFNTAFGRLLCVFDGHGGNEASKYAAENFADLFFKALEDWPHADNAGSVLGVALKKLAQKLQHYDAGTTASVVYLPYNSTTIYTAVIGDSPIILGKSSHYWVSPPHNVRSNPAELEAAQARGGFYSDGYIFKTYNGNGLQMSRALGDAELHPVVSSEPEIHTHTVATGDFLLIGTDGLFDPSNENTKDAMSPILRLIECGADAQTLVDHALAVPTHDNVTAILYRF